LKGVASLLFFLSGLDFLLLVGVCLIILLTLGFYLLFYIISLFYAAINPWVSEVSDMQYGYWAGRYAYIGWLYCKYPRKWVKVTFASSLGSSLLIVGLIQWFWAQFFVHLYAPILLLIGTTLTIGFLIMLPIGFYLVRRSPVKRKAEERGPSKLSERLLRDAERPA